VEQHDGRCIVWRATARTKRAEPRYNDDAEPLARFVKRKGGLNKSTVRYGRCLGRLAVSRRSIAEFRRRAPRALTLQEPLPDGALRIVATDEKEDGLAA
jgi:hypothetical protein